MPFLLPISPFHQFSSERSVTVMTSPRLKSNSPDSCGTKSYSACTSICNKKSVGHNESNLILLASLFVYSSNGWAVAAASYANMTSMCYAKFVFLKWICMSAGQTDHIKIEWNGRHTHLFRYHITQFDILRPGHARRPMIFDQFVEGVELDHPEEEFALGIAQNLEMLNAIGASEGAKNFDYIRFSIINMKAEAIQAQLTWLIRRNRRDWIRWCVSRRRLRAYLTAASQHRRVWCVRNTSYNRNDHYLGLDIGNFRLDLLVILHFYVITRYEAFLSIQLRAIPIWIVFHI